MKRFACLLALFAFSCSEITQPQEEDQFWNSLTRYSPGVYKVWVNTRYIVIPETTDSLLWTDELSFDSLTASIWGPAIKHTVQTLDVSSYTSLPNLYFVYLLSKHPSGEAGDSIPVTRYETDYRWLPKSGTAPIQTYVKFGSEFADSVLVSIPSASIDRLVFRAEVR